jgi:hypothetical protein
MAGGRVSRKFKISEEFLKIRMIINTVKASEYSYSKDYH